jgi:uncharacterized protein
MRAVDATAAVRHNAAFRHPQRCGGLAMATDPTPADPVYAEPVPSTLTAEEKQWAMYCHLAAFLGYLVFLMSFLGPLLVWQLKKDTSRFVDFHGKESLNFQLNMFGYAVLMILFAIATCGIGAILVVPLFSVLAIYVIVMPIVAAVKASNGETYRYPFILRVVQ